MNQKCQCGVRTAVMAATTPKTRTELYACGSTCRRSIDGTILGLEWHEVGVVVSSEPVVQDPVRRAS